MPILIPGIQPMDRRRSTLYFPIHEQSTLFQLEDSFLDTPIH